MLSLTSTILFLPKLFFRLASWPFRYLFSHPPSENLSLQSNPPPNSTDANALLDSEALLPEKFQIACDLLKNYSNLSTQQQLKFYGKKHGFLEIFKI